MPGALTTLVRVGVLVGLTAAPGLVLTGTAAAEHTTVQVVRGQLVIQAAPGQANQLTIVDSGRALVVSDVAPILPGAGCERDTGNQASCSSSGVTSMVVLAGDGDDAVDYAPVPVETWTYAEEGDDIVAGGWGVDHIYGGNGNDTLSGADGTDFLYGDNPPSAPPACEGIKPNNCSDVLSGGAQNDELHGGEGFDELKGEGGDDMLYDPIDGATMFTGGPGNDTIIGSPQPNMRDMAIYGDFPTGVGVNLSDNVSKGTDVTIPAHRGGELGTDGQLVELDIIANVQDVETGSGDDRLVGDGTSNLFDTGSGADRCDHNGDDGVWEWLPC